MRQHTGRFEVMSTVVESLLNKTRRLEAGAQIRTSTRHNDVGCIIIWLFRNRQRVHDVMHACPGNVHTTSGPISGERGKNEIVARQRGGAGWANLTGCDCLVRCFNCHHICRHGVEEKPNQQE